MPTWTSDISIDPAGHANTTLNAAAGSIGTPTVGVDGQKDVAGNRWQYASNLIRGTSRQTNDYHTGILQLLTARQGINQKIRITDPDTVGYKVPVVGYQPATGRCYLVQWFNGINFALLKVPATGTVGIAIGTTATYTPAAAGDIMEVEKTVLAGEFIKIVITVYASDGTTVKKTQTYYDRDLAIGANPGYFGLSTSSGGATVRDFGLVETFYTKEFSLDTYDVGLNQTVTLTLTGRDTTWQDDTAVFEISGVTGCSITGQSIISNTSATLTIATSTTEGTLTITDPTTGGGTNIVRVTSGGQVDNRDLKVVRRGTHDVEKWDAQGGSLGIFATQSVTTTYAVGHWNGFVYVVTLTTPGVYKYDRQGNLLATVDTSLTGTRKFMGMRDGSYLVADNAAQNIIKYTAADVKVGTWQSGVTLTGPYGMASFLDPVDGWTVLSAQFSGSKVVQLTEAGVYIRDFATGLTNASDVVVNPYTNDVYVSAWGADKIQRFSQARVDLGQYGPSIPHPHGMCLTRNGLLLVAAESNSGALLGNRGYVIGPGGYDLGTFGLASPLYVDIELMPTDTMLQQRATRQTRNRALLRM